MKNLRQHIPQMSPFKGSPAKVDGEYNTAEVEPIYDVMTGQNVQIFNDIQDNSMVSHDDPTHRYSRIEATPEGKSWKEHRLPQWVCQELVLFPLKLWEKER